MTRESLIRLNKNALTEMILKLEEENRLLRQNIVYTCMECDKDFEYSQVKNEDSDGNVVCPYCGCGDIVKEVSYETETNDLSNREKNRTFI